MISQEFFPAPGVEFTPQKSLPYRPKLLPFTNMRIKISDVKVGNRIRKNPGDITTLKDSMRRLGLLHPVLIDPQNNLVAGYRRLEAAKLLGWESIEARLVDVKDKKDRLVVESDENTTRRDFTPEELSKADSLMDRYSRKGIFWRFVAWLMDLIDKILRR